MLSIDSLKTFGADTEAGLRRCMDNEALYLRLIGMAAKDTGIKRLQDALDAHDLDAAFESAHALKGIMSNLSLTPLCTPLSAITELLRARTDTDYAPLMTEANARFDELRTLCET